MTMTPRAQKIKEQLDTVLRVGILSPLSFTILEKDIPIYEEAVGAKYNGCDIGGYKIIIKQAPV